MKKIFSTMVVAAALFAGYSTYNAQNSNELTDVALANVEALASAGDDNGCPANHVPNHYLTVKTETHTLQSDSDGKITFKNKTFAGYEKNSTETVVFIIKDCSGEQLEACCDQSKINVDIVK